MKIAAIRFFSTISGAAGGAVPWWLQVDEAKRRGRLGERSGTTAARHRVAKASGESTVGVTGGKCVELLLMEEVHLFVLFVLGLVVFHAFRVIGFLTLVFINLCQFALGSLSVSAKKMLSNFCTVLIDFLFLALLSALLIDHLIAVFDHFATVIVHFLRMMHAPSVDRT